MPPSSATSLDFNTNFLETLRACRPPVDLPGPWTQSGKRLELLMKEGDWDPWVDSDRDTDDGEEEDEFGDDEKEVQRQGRDENALVILGRHRKFAKALVRHRAGTLIAMRRGPNPPLELEYMSLHVRLGMRLIFLGHGRSRLLATKELQEMIRKRSEAEGRKFNDGKNAAKHIKTFIKTYHIDCSQLLLPDLRDYPTMNSFFYRKLRPSARPIASPSDPSIITSAADCRLTVYSSISSAQRFWIKGEHFSLPALLGASQSPTSRRLARSLEGGSLAIFRLAPKDYHRFHSPVDAEVGETVHIAGGLLTVNATIVNDSKLNVFTTNKRDVTVLHVTPPPTYDDNKQNLTVDVALVQVGAMLVGSITQTAREGQQVRKGDELGYFAYGGSTIIVAFPRGRVRWDPDLEDNSQRPVETLVKMGERIGRWVR